MGFLLWTPECLRDSFHGDASHHLQMPLPTGHPQNPLPKSISIGEVRWGGIQSANVQLLSLAFLCLLGPQDCVGRAVSFTTGSKDVFVLTIKRLLNHQLSYPNTFNQS